MTDIIYGLISVVLAVIAAGIAVTVAHEKRAPWGAIALYWMMVTGYWVIRALGK